jgi:hypothetical protein
MEKTILNNLIGASLLVVKCTATLLISLDLALLIDFGLGYLFGCWWNSIIDGHTTVIKNDIWKNRRNKSRWKDTLVDVDCVLII